MTHRQLKVGYFVVEGVNSFATCYYCSYLFFFLRREFGFTDRENLLVSALNGFVYMAGARLGGGFAQRYGCFRSLIVGMSVLIAMLGASAMATSAALLILAMLVWTLGVCFLWPAVPRPPVSLCRGRPSAPPGR